jgi:hypothetical protein
LLPELCPAKKDVILNLVQDLGFDTFDGAKPRFLNRGKKRRSVSTLSIPRASDRGVEWVDFTGQGCFIPLKNAKLMYLNYWS